MAVKIITGDDGHKALYCSTTMQAFGPVFYENDDVDAFLEWLPQDARKYSQEDLDKKAHEWRKYVEDQINELFDQYLGDGNFADNH